jgi:uncharacterized protein YeaO (DUF488 family)
MECEQVTSPPEFYVTKGGMPVSVLRLSTREGEPVPAGATVYLLSQTSMIDSHGAVRSRVSPLGRAKIALEHRMINLKRAYEDVETADGARYLVDRLWPRGKTKAALKIDEWLKDVAPSATLRRWFNHEAEKWNEFRRRYFAELDSKPDAWAPLVDAAREGSITLVYSAHDVEHNNGVALGEYLRAHMGKKGRKRDS